jgi:ERCC4-type nuclease
MDDYEITPYTIIVDSREQSPYSFKGFKCDAAKKGRPLLVCTEVAGLKSGDYSLKGFEDRIAVERKSLQDFYGTLGQGRERFERELVRLSVMDFAAVVVEADWPTILSRTCGDCGGVGAVIEVTQSLVLTLTGHALRLCGADCVYQLARRVMKEQRDLRKCERCKGTGQLKAVEQSNLNPKTIYRSVIAWQQRYPRIHWWMMPTRGFAERTVLRILERFWKDEQERVKQLKKENQG